ncbi:MAG TPA: aspartate/glutamate racemase family protein [Bacillales bacterium]|nr:aspartate/glutamate racemase family protein [Bacillales bacterium]
MKTIGLIGGMSWESTALYYRWLNEKVADRLGGLHSAKCLIYSVDFEEIELMQRQGNWRAAGERLGEAAQCLERAGADFLLICTNTMHKVIADIQNAVNSPVLHIADPTIETIMARDLSKVGLLGTKYTMEQDFYKNRFVEKGIEVLVPEQADRTEVNKIIFEELCRGIVLDASRTRLMKMIEKLVGAGAEGIILGCTEITLLIKPEHCNVPIFDTTEMHVTKAVEWALREEETRKGDQWI